MKEHSYKTHVEWTGNTGDGTKTYKSYGREHSIASEAKPPILASSDPSFRGDAARYNPEELFVASLSSCHMLWYLHLCSVNGVTVTSYEDHAHGVMQETEDGSGAFSKVMLKPKVSITVESDATKAMELHHEAHRMCFIANSVNFAVEVEPRIELHS